MWWINGHTNPKDVILGMPRTIVAGDWGSYITILTGRTALDGTECPSSIGTNCDAIYRPNSPVSMKFYIEQSIDYVYAGKVILGPFGGKEFMDFNYKATLDQAKFLTKVVDYPELGLGSVAIYKVNQEMLLNEYANATN
jgi:hypothetical protein